MEFACAYRREEDCLGKGEWRRLLQTSWEARSSTCATRSSGADEIKGEEAEDYGDF